MRTAIIDALGDLTYAGRALARRPAYAAVAATTLAFGIGANVAIFSVVNAVLLRPLPYPDADRIVTVRHHAPGINMPEVQSSPGLVQHYRESSHTLTTVAGYQMRSGNLAGDGHPERVRTVAVTSEFFDALAVQPALGRAFRRDDEQQGPPRVCILTDAIWRSRFGGDVNIVGRRVRLDGHPIEIVGVMPTRFAFPDAETPLLVPLWLDPQFGAFGMRTLARLAPGTSLAAAREEIAALQRRIPERFPEFTKETLDRFGWSVTLEPLRDTVTGTIATPLWLLSGSVALVLLIAGANAANLFLVRAESRQREMALRAALGGSRTRLTWTFVAESLLLAAIGGFFGSLLAAAGVRLLVAYGPPQLPRLKEIVVDPASLGFAAVVSLVAGVVLGLVTVPGLTRRSFADALRDGGRGHTAGRQKHRVRQLLIVGQVSMALVLLVGSGLMLRSIARVLAVDPGFRIEGLLTAGVSLGRQPDRARMTAFYDRVLAEVGSLPGVTSVGASNSLPIEAASLNGSSFAIQSRPVPQNQIPPVTMYQVITAGYFETLGMSLRAGRLPTRADAEPGRSVVWVNETFARRFLGERVIGERIQLDDHWLDIVGIVNDVRTFGLREEIRPMAYLPLGTPVTGVTLDTMNLLIRSAAPLASLAPALRPALERVDASLPLTRIRSMDDIVSTSLAQASFTMTLLAIAAVVALVLGVVGLYGVISYVVSQRTQEIGVRLALGARPADVRRMVLRQGLGVALVGIVVGLAAAAAVTGVMSSLLFEISTRDPVTFAAVAFVLIGVSALATYLPARKASAIDPLEALRQEG